jgi:plasmid maintenance system antidote protein VapI
MSAVTAAPEPGSVAKLLDFLITEHDLKNDAALAREMKVAPPVISKLRKGSLQLGPTYILHIHEHFGIAVGEIRDRAAMHH